MDRRVLLTIALSGIIFFGWAELQRRYGTPPVDPATTVAATGTPSAPAAAPGATAVALAPGTRPEAPAAAPGVRPPEQKYVVTRPGLYRAEFSSWGAAPVSFSLLDPQYTAAGSDGKDAPIELVRAAGGPTFLTSFSSKASDKERSDFDLPPDAAWTVLRASPEELVYAADVGTVHVEKKWTLPATGYRLGLSLTVDNRGSAPIGERLAVSAAGYHDPSVKQGGMLSFGKRVNMTMGGCDVNGKLEQADLEKLIKESITRVGDVRWVGASEQFFLSALALGPESEARACEVSAETTGRIRARSVGPLRTVAPGSQVVHEMAAYLGPKHLHALDAVAVAGQPARLGDSVNYTLEFVARPMLWTLKQIQRVVVNWGLAIITITILLKIATLYPTQKSMQSMKQMARLKPEMDKIKEQYADDKNMQNQKTMELYKREGINPIGGCLPMVIQMPIYIAFYSMLSNAVELYHASFVGPITDMTAPFVPMSLLTGGLMFLQQRNSPAAQDPQQRAMMYTMPVMFTAFTALLPSGLTLYILTNTLLTMVHQWYMNRRDPKPVGK